MPIAPVGQGLLRSTAAELSTLQQQLAEVDPNDPQAIMQLQQQIAQLYSKADAQQALTRMAALEQEVDALARTPGPAGKDATVEIGRVETLPPEIAATADMVDGQLNLGIPRGQTGTSGSSIMSGDGAPSKDLGAPGDTYIDVSTGDVYTKA